ncbi:MAG: long-chain fatty acid--CoA ligase [Sphingobacteriales bacterium]|nr:MAG: long-chain fatty acid--CoA ligase [Sphingobacteriales bacterium]
MITIIEKSKAFAGNTAIVDVQGAYSYEQLRMTAQRIAANIVAMQPAAKPIFFLIPSGFSYVAVQWGIWLAGNIAVPIHIAHPISEISYLLEDTGSELLIYEESLADKAKAIAGARIIPLGELLQPAQQEAVLPVVTPDDDAMMIYTSGTTGRPKGVVMTHAQLDAQMRSLTEAWGWSEQDRILNVLPMHHVHGVINITCCALYNGAVLEMQSGFDPAQVCARMGSRELTIFMAVPTIYHKLVQYFEELPAEAQKQWQRGMAGMRLMVSGSAALPVTVLERWKKISGHTLLERYGMTEIGMALSNPLDGLRKPGYVGMPLPLVQVKIVDEQGVVITANKEPGELHVQGATVFKRYWKRPEETAQSFADGWFKTGDIAERDDEGYYRILGRNSSDIIKSGGYKISALEIENAMLEHEGIVECAVVALPSEEWGETIAAAFTGNADPESLGPWLKNHLAPYKIPRQFICVAELPRNAMGKLIKNQVKEMF